MPVGLKIKNKHKQWLGFNTNTQEILYCTPGGSRTPNLLVRSQTLYPIELRAQVYVNTTLRICTQTRAQLFIIGILRIRVKHGLKTEHANLLPPASRIPHPFPPILLLITSHDCVMRKLSSILSTMVSNLVIGTEKVSSPAATT